MWRVCDDPHTDWCVKGPNSNTSLGLVITIVPTTAFTWEVLVTTRPVCHYGFRLIVVLWVGLGLSCGLGSGCCFVGWVMYGCLLVVRGVSPDCRLFGTAYCVWKNMGFIYFKSKMYAQAPPVIQPLPMLTQHERGENYAMRIPYIAI